MDHKRQRKLSALRLLLEMSLIDNVRKRFIREVSILSGINHANIMPILDSDLQTNPPSYIMPLADSSLADDISYLKANIKDALVALLDILAGLEELHSLIFYIEI